MKFKIIFAVGLASVFVCAFFGLVVTSRFSNTPKVYAATATVNMLTTDSFAVLAGAHVIDSNVSSVTGNVGLSPAGWGSSSPLITCSEVTGTIYSVDGSGPATCRVTDPGILTQAKNDLTTAYGVAGGRTPFTTLSGSDNQLGGQTLTDGVYRFSAASSQNLVGTLTLDGQGNSDSVFIFQAASTLITASSSVVSLINGAQACNVFWYVPTSATLGTGSTFVGTVMADQSITDNGGSTVNGRFLASVADVTLNNTTISKPTCTITTTTTTSSSTSTTNYEAPAVPPCPTIELGVVAPTIIDSRRVDADSIYISWGPYSGTNEFIVRYGLTKDNLIYNVDAAGFYTTINALPANQPIWVQVAARNECRVGENQTAIMVGNPGLPNTGVGDKKNNNSWSIIASVILGISIILIGRRARKSVTR